MEKGTAICEGSSGSDTLGSFFLVAKGCNRGACFDRCLVLDVVCIKKKGGMEGR